MNGDLSSTSRESLPVLVPLGSEGADETAAVWGVLLAAGTSSRFRDRNKLLMDIDNEPMIKHVAETLVASDLEGVVVVVGHEAKKVRSCLSDLPVAIRKNESYDEGQSTSVHEGVGHVAAQDADAVLIALGDMPYVSVETIDMLLAAYQAERRPVLAAGYNGERGNPVLFSSNHFETLTSVEGDTGGRENPFRVRGCCHRGDF